MSQTTRIKCLVVLVPNYHRPISRTKRRIRTAFLICFTSTILLRRLVCEYAFFVSRIMNESVFQVRYSDLHRVVFPTFYHFSKRSVSRIGTSISRSYFPTTFCNDSHLCHHIPTVRRTRDDFIRDLRPRASAIR